MQRPGYNGPATGIARGSEGGGGGEMGALQLFNKVLNWNDRSYMERGMNMKDERKIDHRMRKK